ncbi:MAG TPA: GNAT family N-acetyltransferase [Actinoplanes sp.]|nr:GNAT family N-acetyltransferase [Actinoplanes sp.]
MTDWTIRTAESPADVVAAAELIAFSFDDLRPNRYLVPEPESRRAIMAGYFGLAAGHAAGGAGEVHLLERDGELAATAVWFDRTGPETPFPDYDERLRQIVPIEMLPRFEHLDKTLDENHLHDPHFHLAFVAVHPDHQGQGHGTRLVEGVHRRLDENGVVSFLEATNEANQALYRRLGYVDVATVTLEDGTPFHQMRRSPAA